ncbi:hypothetical protein Kpho02_10350 [Kitasatospora phosalacinea]|uniref:Uncharacterized protein n=1 Tax=Kitasatospora phosalacinea TaxID=2065 RepID=A0A9W6Q586_9ACTN|nr:WD40 repeat domain-containing protein [Kitasatospora phosalacinea]GLW68736.1 hypothetical protein Kpho02_10350 [Kitasatospora phosalacinea]
MGEGGSGFPPLRAGRRPAGLALLGWLDDRRAPRLCRVEGAPGSGKSHLLAWLTAGCTADGAPEGRRIHLVLPAAGLSLRAAAWQLGNQLDTVARTPGDVLAVLAADDRPTTVCVPELNRAAEPDRLVAELLDPLLELDTVRLLVEAPGAAFTREPSPAVLDLDDPRWTDRERFTAWCTGQDADPAAYPNPGRALGTAAPAGPAPLADLLARVPDGPAGLPGAGAGALTALWTAARHEGGHPPLLADPLLYVLPDPAAVTAGLDAAGLDAAGARAAGHPLALAWDAAGPALVDTADAPVRAHLLRARLLGGGEEARAAAERLSGAPGAWAARWARWEPGQAVTAAPGAGPHRGQWLTADGNGTVRVLSAATGEPLGRPALPAPRPLRGLAVTPSGTLLLLDAEGGTELLTADRPAPGLDRYALEEAVSRLRDAAGAPAAVAAAGRLPGAAPALADADGAVHWYQDGRVHGERLHTGPVTALAVAALGADDPRGGLPLLVSGGYDGTVRLWGPGSAPMAEPLDARPCPVVAVAADEGPDGLRVAAAWAGGLVRVHRPGDPAGVLELRPGSPVRALALDGRLLLLALADGLLAVDLQQP